MRRVKKVQDLRSHLLDLQDSQMATSMLRSCLAVHKMSFTLHSCPPSYIQEAVTAFDNSIEDDLSDLAGGPLPKWSWLEASFPISLGSLGL